MGNEKDVAAAAADASSHPGVWIITFEQQQNKVTFSWTLPASRKERRGKERKGKGKGKGTVKENGER